VRAGEPWAFVTVEFQPLSETQCGPIREAGLEGPSATLGGDAAPQSPLLVLDEGGPVELEGSSVVELQLGEGIRADPTPHGQDPKRPIAGVQVGPLLADLKDEFALVVDVDPRAKELDHTGVGDLILLEQEAPERVEP
jgi:hypothetical protein